MPTATGSINLTPQLNAKNYVDTAIDNLETELNSSRVWYADCSSSAGSAKEATIVPATTDFELTTGTIVYVKFTTTNSLAVASLTLNVNNTGAKPIKRYGTTNLAAVGNITGGMVCQFVYDGTNWLWVGHVDTNSTYNLGANQHSSAITAKSNITRYYLICGDNSGYQNVAANATFDLTYPILYAQGGAINATKTATNTYESYPGVTFSTTGSIVSGAANKMLYLKGSVTNNTFTIASTDFFTTVIPNTEDGYVYMPLGIMTSATAGYFQSSKDLYAFKDGAFGPVSIREASAASKTATTYITHIDDNGITIHPKNATNNVYPNRVGINANGMNVYKDNVSVGSYGDTTRIGKADESHVFLDYHSLQLVDQEGQTYFYVSDLRNAQGVVTVEETYAGDGTTTEFRPCFAVLNTISITDSSNANNTYIWSTEEGSGDFYTFATAPAANATVTLIYTSSDSNIKAYTFGNRKSNSNIGGLSVAEGIDIDASGNYSHAEGRETTASRITAHAEGSYTIASGAYSHAEGYTSEASGHVAHAEGHFTTASSFYAHSEGSRTVASNMGAHAEGGNTIASGLVSHAEGNGTVASGTGSHASGLGTIASGSYQMAIGTYNAEDQAAVFIIGDGSGSTSEERSNAMVVNTSGHMILYRGIEDYLKLVSTNLTLDSTNRYGNSRIRFLDDTDTLYGEIVPAMLTSGTTLMRLACTNPISSVTNYIEVRVTSAGDKTYYVSDQANFRSAIGLSSTDTNLTLSGTSAGTVHMVRNETTVTIFINGIKLSSALNAGSFVTIATVPSGYRPAYYAYAPVCAPVNGYPQGVIGLVDTNGNVRIGNRSSAQLAAGSTTWNGIITYVV